MPEVGACCLGSGVVCVPTGLPLSARGRCQTLELLPQFTYHKKQTRCTCLYRLTLDSQREGGRHQSCLVCLKKQSKAPAALPCMANSTMNMTKPRGQHKLMSKPGTPMMKGCSKHGNQVHKSTVHGKCQSSCSLSCMPQAITTCAVSLYSITISLYSKTKCARPCAHALTFHGQYA
eukprot:scaffold185395_cov23-Tisochrysis_lutea.AAC.2